MTEKIFPYELPQNWRWVTFENVCNFERGITFPASAKELKSTEKNIPCVRTANVQSELDISDLIYIDKSYTKNNSSKLLQVGDIIMSSANSKDLVGKTCYVESVPFEMTFGGFVLVIRTEKILNRYLFYFLRCEFLLGKFIDKSSQTVNIANISTSKLSSYNIPLPPLAEQKKIVERIESLFSKLDSAKEKVQKILDGYELRRSAILHKAFTGALTKNFRAENNLSLDDWQEKTLGEITNIKSSKRIFKKEYVKEGVPFFRGSEIVELNDTGRVTPIYFISENRYREISKQNDLPRKGDLLITSVGTIGKTWIVDDREFYYKDGNITLVEHCNQLDMFYLQYYVQSEFFKTIVSENVAGSAYNALTIVKLKKIKMPLSPLAEQKEIVRVLDSLLDKEQRTKKIAEKILWEIDLMRKSILARAFRGEL